MILDLFAEWCGPCWNYHNTGTNHPNAGALKTVWNNYGPDGTDEVMVFAIETDPNTADSLMYGGVGTQGWDWVTNTPYPMAGANIGDIFNQAYYPFIIRICPNRQIFELGQASSPNIYAEVGTCLSQNGENNGALLSYTGESGTCDNPEMRVNLQNLGSSNLTSATISISSTGSDLSATYDWTGNLAPYEVEEVALGFAALTEPSDVTFAISTPNESVDEFADDNEVFASLAPPVETANLIEVEINTDTYGAETYWRIVNQSGQMLVQGGNQAVGTNNVASQAVPNAPNGQGAYAANQTYTTEFELPANDCFTFEIYDYFQDGICCQYGNGSYKVTDVYAETVILSGGTFGHDDEANMTANALSVDDIESLESYTVYPNPTRDNLNVQFELNSSNHVTLDVHNIVGQLISSQDFGILPAGSNLRSVDVSGHPEGIYLLVMTIDGQQSVKKFTISK